MDRISALFDFGALLIGGTQCRELPNPIAVCGQQGMDAQLFCSVQVELAVVDEQCLVGIDVGPVDYRTKDFGLGLFQMHYVRKKYMPKPIGCLLALVAHAMGLDEFPMDFVAVAEDVEVVLRLKPFQRLKAFCGNRLYKTDPCIVNLLVGDTWHIALATHRLIEVRRRHGATVYLLENAVKLRILTGKNVACASYFLKFCKTAFGVEVAYYASKIENNIFYFIIFHCLQK